MSKKSAYLLFFIILFVFIVFISQRTNNKSSSSTPDKFEVVSMAEQFVMGQLKSPSTAEFCTVSKTSIVTMENHEFAVRGYVDAQNSFGAMLRNDYYVKMRYDPTTQRYTLLDMKIE